MEGSQPKPGIYPGQPLTSTTTPEEKARGLDVTPYTGASSDRPDDSTPPAIPIELRLLTKIAQTQDTILPSALSPIASSPPDEGAPAIEQPKWSSPDGYFSRRRSSQLSTDSQGSEPTPHFLSIQSRFGSFRQYRSASLTETSSITLPSTLTGSLVQGKEWGDLPGKKILQRSYSMPVSSPPKLERQLTPPELLKYMDELPAIGGLDAVSSYPGQGIPEEHLNELAQTCRLFRLVIAIRPFPETATLPALDGAKSKALHYKLKSSTWGAQSPYLPANQKYSKLFDAPADKLHKFQGYADERADEAVQLKQTDQHLKNLQTLKLPGSDVPLIEHLKYLADNQINFQCRPLPEYEPFFYRGTKTEDGDWLIDIQEDDEFVPLKVIPLIPDYDLCFLYSLQEDLDLSGKDKVPVPDINPDEIRKRIARLEGKALSEQSKAEFAKIQLDVQSLKSFLQKMDQVYGNLTRQEQRYLRALNYAIGRTRRNPMFHHGADNNNPVSDLDSNFPLTVVLPRIIEPLTERFYIIEDEKQLKAFINLLKDSGYYAPTNPSWGSIHRVRSKSFRRYSAVVGEPMIPPKRH